MLFSSGLAVLVISTSARATQYFVKTGGNDSLDGLSDVNAWASIAKVNGRTFAPGDVIQFRRGSTWTGTTLVVNTLPITSEAQRVTYGAYGEAADPRPILSVPGLTCLQASGHDYITIQDFDLRNGRNGLDMGKARHFIVRRLKISNVVQNGMAIKQGGHHTIDDCEVTDFGAGGIHLKGSYADAEPMHDVVVSNCYVHDSKGGAFHPDGIVIHQSSEPGNPKAGANFILRGNRADNAGEQGFDITTGNHILLEDNTTEGNRAGAITVGHTAHDVTVRRHFSRNEPANNTATTLAISAPGTTIEYCVFVGSPFNKPILILKPSFDTSVTPPVADDQPENVKLHNNVFIWNYANEGNMFLLTAGTSGGTTIPLTIRNLAMKNNIFASANGATGVLNFAQPDRPPNYRPSISTTTSTIRPAGRSGR
jgi:hypothetical protein